jgi:hypothetical protein
MSSRADPAEIDPAMLNARDLSKLSKGDLTKYFAVLQTQYAERGQKYG